MPQAVHSIGERIHSSDRFPSLDAWLFYFQLQISAWNAMNADGRWQIPVLMANRIVGHDVCNFRVGVQPIHEKTQVVLVNEEAESWHRGSVPSQS